MEGNKVIRILGVDISCGDAHMYELLYKAASPERKQRADRYRRPEDKLRCVIADGLLRTALGTASYTVEKGRYGKPYLKDRKDFFYNLSHSGRYVVMAWGSSEVGIDVQEHRAGTDLRALAAYGFAPDEYAYVFRCDTQIPQRFYDIWTAKESYLKYTGKGLGMDLRSFSVMQPDAKVRYLRPALEDGYSLCLCTVENQCTTTLLDLRQLS
jgi:4'-phosphopantetheinyl transferase